MTVSAIDYTSAAFNLDYGIPLSSFSAQKTSSVPVVKDNQKM